MQIASFLAHYQLVYINFDLSSFFLISCIINSMLLRRYIHDFAALEAVYDAAK